MRIFKLKDYINKMNEEQLHNCIVSLENRNYRLSQFCGSSVLTSNTYSIVQNYNLNLLIIKLCKQRLRELKNE